MISASQNSDGKIEYTNDAPASHSSGAPGPTGPVGCTGSFPYTLHNIQFSNSASLAEYCDWFAKSVSTLRHYFGTHGYRFVAAEPMNENLPPDSLSGFKFLVKISKNFDDPEKEMLSVCLNEGRPTDIVKAAYFEGSAGETAPKNDGPVNANTCVPIINSAGTHVTYDDPKAPYLTKIVDYFKKLGAEVIGIQRVLWHRDGSVFIATFKETTFKETTPRDKAFAVIVNGEVSGYDIELWKDQDQYKMVLQQHLGMIQMDSEKKPLGEVVTPLSGAAKASTIDAIVETYEAMVRDLKEKHQDELIKATAVAAQFQYSNDLAKNKLAQIEAVISGQKIPNTKEINHPKKVAEYEKEAIGAAIEADETESCVLDPEKIKEIEKCFTI